MHDTAYTIGGLIIQTYCPAQDARILEIGSYAVNGALRDHASSDMSYVGLDIAAGPGVDIVSQPGKPFPVDDDSFDLVMASSVFEHDAAFWLTFLEMCRKAKPGGYVYISAPSNGAIHRYPQDNWRFYPDSGLALAKWAQSQDLDVVLLESFVAARESDIWNDYVAVFHKGPANPDKKDGFVYQQIACNNVITWLSDEVRHRRDETEDMVLIATERANAAQFQAEKTVQEQEFGREREAFSRTMADKALEIEALRARIAVTEAEIIRLAEFEQKLVGLSTEYQALTNRLADTDSTLRQREEEIAQTGVELAAERTAKRALEAQIAQLLADTERQSRKLKDESAWVFKLAGERQAAEKQIQAAQAALAAERRDRSVAEAALERAEFKLQAALQARVEPEKIASHELESVPPPAMAPVPAPDPSPALVTDLDLARREQVALRGQLSERFNEIAILTQLLRRQESEAAVQADHKEWLRDMTRARMEGARWWWAFMPSSWRSRRELDRLARRGLFDSAAYLKRYPDVAQSGMNPLRHYILHGMAEGRSLLR